MTMSPSIGPGGSPGSSAKAGKDSTLVGCGLSRKSAFSAAMRASSPFVCLLGVGLSAMLGWQSLIILGGTLKLIPLTGITLPFVSYGGSSMLISCTMVGLLIRASNSPLRALDAYAAAQPNGRGR